jgi:hypothetical protein
MPMDPDQDPASPSDRNRSSRLSHALKRIKAALPPPSWILFGSALWGGLMGTAVIVAIWRLNGLATLSPLAIFSLFFYGGALGFGPGLTLANLIAGRRGRTARFLLGSIVMLVVTHTATAVLYALQYRMFYAHWHADFPSLVWFFQLGFTSAGAAYVYLTDARLWFWPFPFLPFLGFGLWFAARRAQEPH